LPIANPAKDHATAQPSPTYAHRYVKARDLTCNDRVMFAGTQEAFWLVAKISAVRRMKSLGVEAIQVRFGNGATRLFVADKLVSVLTATGESDHA